MCAMNHTRLILSNQMEEFISIQTVENFFNILALHAQIQKGLSEGVHDNVFLCVFFLLLFMRGERRIPLHLNCVWLACRQWPNIKS